MTWPAASDRTGMRDAAPSVEPPRTPRSRRVRTALARRSDEVRARPPIGPGGGDLGPDRRAGSDHHRGDPGHRARRRSASPPSSSTRTPTAVRSRRRCRSSTRRPGSRRPPGPRTRARLDLPTLARLAPVAIAGLRVLTGIPKAERWPEIRPAALERVLTVGRSLGQVVVVDCGFSLEDDEELSYDTMAPRRNAATLTTLALADEVVVVGGCDPVGLQRLVRGLQELGTVPAPPPTVVREPGPVRSGRRQPGAAGVRGAGPVRGGERGALRARTTRRALDTALLEGRALVECAPAVAGPAGGALARPRRWPAPRSGSGRRRRRGLRVSR